MLVCKKLYSVEGRRLAILATKYQFNDGKLTQKKRSLNFNEKND